MMLQVDEITKLFYRLMLTAIYEVSVVLQMSEEKFDYSQIDASKLAAQVSTQAHWIWHFLDSTKYCVLIK